MTERFLKNKAVIMTIIISVLLFNNGFCVIKTAYAQEIHSLEEIIGNTVFIAFHKEINGENGNLLGIGFHVPNEYYYSGYKYGTAIFPEKMMERYDMYDDFLGRKERDGISVMNLQGNGAMRNGYRIMIYDVVHFPEAALSQRIAFVFYVMDAEGNVAYSTPYISTINDTDPVIEDSSEWSELLQRRLYEKTMNEQFEVITEKTVELVDSVRLYTLIGCASVVIVWGCYIGIRIIIAKKKDEQINAKGMVMGLLIGIVIMAVLAVCAPLLIKGLAVWVDKV